MFFFLLHPLPSESIIFLGQHNSHRRRQACQVPSLESRAGAGSIKQAMAIKAAWSSNDVPLLYELAINLGKLWLKVSHDGCLGGKVLRDSLS